MTTHEHILFMDNRSLLHEGSQKNLYDSREPNIHILHFKDKFLHESKGIVDVPGKGVINNRISESIFTKLNEMGFLTHFVQRQNMREQIVHALEMVPIVLRVRNVVVGDLAIALSLDEGALLTQPILEIVTKDGNRLINESHLEAIGWASKLEIIEMQTVALRVNDIVSGYFASAGIALADISLEFGRYFTPLLDDTQIMLGDEISPDSCTLLDSDTCEKMGRDADAENLEEGYKKIIDRLNLKRTTTFSPDRNNVMTHNFASKKDKI